MQINIYYVHDLIDRIGELVGEMWRIKNLFNNTQYKINVITSPLYKCPRVNKSAFNIAMRDVNVIFTSDFNSVERSQIENSLPALVKEKNNIVVILTKGLPVKSFYKKYFQEKPEFYFSLTEVDLKRGSQIRRAFNIPEKAPIITLHVRESGYLPCLDYHSYRDASINNFMPTVKFLIENGFYVIRLGDKSMKKIINAPPQFIDAPFHSQYTDFVDIYFISQSTFYLGCPSGPFCIAMAFDVPILSTNTIILSVAGWHSGIIKMYKKYYSNKLNRFLSYEEILSSPLLHYARTENYQKAGVELIENTPEEILAATKEILERLNGNYFNKEEKHINLRIKDIHKRILYLHKRNKNEQDHILISTDQISTEFIKLNPNFLGHDWSI